VVPPGGLISIKGGVMDKKKAVEQIRQIGEKLGYASFVDVPGPGSITVDVAWFFKYMLPNGEMPVLQGFKEYRAIAAFEIADDYWNKSLREDIFDLEKCGARVLAIVIPPLIEIYEHMRKSVPGPIWGRSLEQDIKAIERDIRLSFVKIHVLLLNEVETRMRKLTREYEQAARFLLEPGDFKVIKGDEEREEREEREDKDKRAE